MYEYAPIARFLANVSMNEYKEKMAFAEMKIICDLERHGIDLDSGSS